MRLKVAALLVLVGMLLTTAQLFAHHSFAAEFDEKKPVTITLPASDRFVESLRSAVARC
jgi:hypothetical protein